MEGGSRPVSVADVAGVHDYSQRERGRVSPLKDFVQRVGLGSVFGWMAIGAGGILLLVGYVQVSGTSVVSDQLAYIAGTVSGGIFLLVAGIALLLTDHYRNLAEVAWSNGASWASAAPVPPARGAGLDDGSEATIVQLGDSGSFHRTDCTLVSGRDDLEVITPASARRTGLRPCQLCEPGNL